MANPVFPDSGARLRSALTPSPPYPPAFVNHATTAAPRHSSQSDLRSAKAERLDSEATGMKSWSAPRTGIVLIDSSLNPIASNSEAVQILAYPDNPASIRRTDVFLAERMRSSVFSQQLSRAQQISVRFPSATDLRSGNRHYKCRVFALSAHTKKSPWVSLVLVLERNSSSSALEHITAFHLTQRERDIVELLQQGFTSKEMAVRLNISPNTVKAVLRLVMIKLGVSTRSGVVGKVFAGNS